MKRRALAWQIGLLLAAALPVVAALPAVAQTPDQAGTTSSKKKKEAKQPQQLPTIVVTAQRRAQNLQEVPISVSAINTAELDRRGIENVADLNGVSPSVVVMSTTGGYTAGAQIDIRGSFQGNPALYWDSPNAIYVDGVYIGKPKGSVFNLPDLERVELLRGPQGTLFGRNTMSGAINLITQKPSGVFGGRASLGFGKYNQKVGSLVVDLPAMGKLKASVGGQFENRDGWVKTTAGSPVSSLGKVDDKSAFVALRLDATDNLTFDYRYDHSEADDTPAFNQVVHSDVLQMFHIPGLIVNTDRQTTASIDFPVFERVNIDSNMLHIAWNLGVGTVKYIGANREMHADTALDLDGSPIPFAQAQEFNRYHQTSHELQYLGSVGRWNWVTGLYYFDDSGFNNNPQSYFFGAATFNPNYYSFGTLSRAAYGQVDYKLTDRLTVTAGLRRTIESKRVSRFEQAGPYVVIPNGTAAKTSFASTTPAFNVTYQLDADHMLYGRYAKGFMTGGFNAEAASAAEVMRPFKPQISHSFEFGSKNTFLDGKARINADVFYTRTTNLQAVVFTAAGAAASNVLNVGKVHTEGLELEAWWQPTRNFDLHATYSYMVGKVDKFVVLGQDIAASQKSAGVPRNMFSLAMDQVFWRSSHGVLSGSVDYRFIGGYLRYGEDSWIAGYGTLNGRLAFSGMQWGNVEGAVSLWVNNITDVAHINNFIDFGPGFGNLIVANFNMPRSYGINFTANW